jgi:uncharacterized protein
VPRSLTLDHLRRYAVARSLFKPTSLPGAVRKLGFVQADPIRAPARAQDLTLRHRVDGYRAGDLERRYAACKLEEDYLVNYGFLPREHLALMHPRVARLPWDAATHRRAADVLAFIAERGPTHPRLLDQHFAHGLARNYWGGQSRASTQLLDAMHHRGLLRVARRDGGTRVFEVADHPAADPSPEARAARAGALLQLVLRKYAPLPARSFSHLVYLLGSGAPHLAQETRAALRSAHTWCASARVDGVTWYWPAGENPAAARWQVDDRVRLLAPFDPVVWDRPRFELLWGWAYRFEAYTPAARRQFGYYALPLLWRDRVIGWGNVLLRGGALQAAFGHVAARPPADRGYRHELDAELERLRAALGPAE